MAKHSQKTTKKKPAVPTNRPTIQSRSFFESSQAYWILGLIAFVLFSKSLLFGFVLDDVAVIEQNKFVQEGFAGIPDLLSTFYWQGYWDTNAGLFRPLSLIMFAIEWQISPNNPAIHHWVNVLFYALLVVQLFRLLKNLFPEKNPKLAFFIVLLFAVHPMHTEVVANIKSRDEIMGLFFLVLMGNRLLKKEEQTIRTKILAAVYFLLALLSKESALLFLPVLLVYFSWYKKEKWSGIFRKLLPLAIVAVGWFAWRTAVISQEAHPVQPYTYADNSLVACGSKSDQLATGVWLFGKYMRNTVYPVSMSYDYSYPQIACVDFGNLQVWGIIFLTIAISVILWFIRKKVPEMLFGWLFFVVTISLATNIFTLIGTTFADRLLFTPVLGILIMLVFGIDAVLSRRPGLNRKTDTVIFSILVLPLVWISWNRTKAWESNEQLFTTDRVSAPNSARVNYNYATLLSKDSATYQEAINYFTKALELDPKDYGSYVNLGYTYFRVGNYESSLENTLKAHALNPQDTTIYANIGDAYFKLNRLDTAVTWYEKIMGSEAATVGNYEFCGTAYFNMKQYDQAAKVFELGLNQYPNYENLAMNLGNTYGASGNFARALEVFEAVYQANPNNRKALELVIMSAERAGNPEKRNQYIEKLNGGQNPQNTIHE